MIFKIKSGNHYSNGFIYKIFHMLNFSNDMEYYVTFDKDSTYVDTTDHKFDVNKLFGFSIGYHHNNSHRFGWNVIDGKIHIQSYSYINKIRIIKDICVIKPETKYKFTIFTNDPGTNVTFTVVTAVDGVYSEMEVGSVTIPTNCRGGSEMVFGYKLWPYFGGTKVAPQEINILLNKKL